MSTAPAFASASEAMEMVHAGLGWLAAADATALGGEEQARCLQMLEQANSMGTAARASVLAAFTAGQGYSADADYSPRAWLIHKTRITKGAAVGHTAWARRAARHPLVAAVLAGGQMSESFGRMICCWTDSCRRTAGRPPMRSCSPLPPPGWTCRSWPRWPGRSTTGTGRTSPIRIRTGGWRTGRFGW